MNATLVKTSARRAALLVALVAQIVMFLIFLPRPVRVEGDNGRYETAGYNLASGAGLSLPYELQPDDDVKRWACSRNPPACENGDIPTAMYPPGYQLYVAAIYDVVGRRLTAIAFSQLVLLLGMVWAFERLAAAFLGRAGYLFAMAIAISYPFLAHQAGTIMSDMLHAALVLFGLAVLALGSPGVARSFGGGLLLGAATLTRPYSFVCLPFVAYALGRKPHGEGEKWVAAVSAFAAGALLPMALWASRNAVVFGRFIPFGTTGLGVSLYCNKLAWTIGSPYDAGNSSAIYAELSRMAGGDPYTWHANRVLTAAAFEWMREHPWNFLASLPLRVVRVWVSLGTAGAGISRAWPLLVVYLGGLLGLGVAGMWVGRRRREIVLMALFILPYWAFLLHVPAEARRTLALRLPMLLCAGVAVDAWVLSARFGQGIRRRYPWLAPEGATRFVRAIVGGSG
jgi:hypothetical protein